VDARKLADLLRSGMLRPVYHGENGLRTLRELARSYQTIGKDLTRVMNRLKALYQSCRMRHDRYYAESRTTPHSGSLKSGKVRIQQLTQLAIRH
jgi:hypothetical protein